MKQQPEIAKSAPAQPQSAKKKPYVTPRLTTQGKLSQITAGSGARVYK